MKSGVMSRRLLLSGATAIGLGRFLPTHTVRAADACACLAQSQDGCQPPFSSLLLADSAATPAPALATVAVGEPGSVPTILNSDGVRFDNPAFRYLGATPVVAGDIPARGYYVRPSEQTMIWAVDIAFPDGCSVFEIATFGTGSGWFRVIADGMLAHEERSIQGPPADGNEYLIRVDFGSYLARSVRIEMTSGFWFRGFTVPPGTVVAPLDQEIGPRVIIVGDSFAEGTGAPSALEGFVSHLASFMGWIDVAAAAQGGTGYLNPGPAELNRSPFIDRAARDVIARQPNVVIVFGGLNDSGRDPAELEDAARAYYQTILDGILGVTLIVVGPIWPRSVDGYQPIIDASNAVKNAASGLATLYIDPLDPEWITGTRDDPSSGNAANLIGEDGTHPTPEGHIFIACKIATALQGVVL